MATSVSRESGLGKRKLLDHVREAIRFKHYRCGRNKHTWTGSNASSFSMGNVTRNQWALSLDVWQTASGSYR
jgi:hypothetical protein